VNEKDFEKDVRKKAPPGVSSDTDRLEEAIDYFVRLNPPRQGQFTRAHVAECIQKAGSIATARKKERQKDSKEEDVTPGFRFPPAWFIESDKLANEIEPWVKHVRNKIFDATSAPFNDYQDAVDWLIETEKKSPQPTDEDLERAAKVRERIREQQKKHRDLTRSPVRIIYETLMIPYAKRGDEYVQRVSVGIDPPLGLLAQESKAIAEATGFSQVSVVAYILADIKPIVRPIVAKLYPHMSRMPDGAEVWRRHAVIEVNSGNISQDDFKSVFKQVKTNLQPEGRKKRPTKKDLTRLSVIEDLGDRPPEEKVKAYYTRVMVEYNSRVKPKDRYTSWYGPYKAQMRYLQKEKGSA